MIDLIIIGAGGYAKSVLDSLDTRNFNLVGFIDSYKYKKEKYHLGYPILGENVESINNFHDYVYFIAIGNNGDRKKWFEYLKKNNLKLINVIDKNAIVSEHSVLGEGCFIGKMAIINSKVKVGDNCIINTRALAEHGCMISNNVNVSTNTVLNGDVKIGDSTFVGSCSVINGQITIGSNVMIGSGSVVIKDIEDNCTAVGVPAKVIKKGGKRI